MVRGERRESTKDIRGQGFARLRLPTMLVANEIQAHGRPAMLEADNRRKEVSGLDDFGSLSMTLSTYAFHPHAKTSSVLGLEESPTTPVERSEGWKHSRSQSGGKAGAYFGSGRIVALRFDDERFHTVKTGTCLPRTCRTSDFCR